MQDSDVIVIENLRLECIVGAHAWEKTQPQAVVISARLHADLRKAGDSDRLADTVDYGAVVAAIEDHARSSSHQLVEALAAGIARLCLERFGVARVWVKVGKPCAVRGLAEVSVEIDRVARDFP